MNGRGLRSRQKGSEGRFRSPQAAELKTQPKCCSKKSRSTSQHAKCWITTPFIDPTAVQRVMAQMSPRIGRGGKKKKIRIKIRTPFEMQRIRGSGYKSSRSHELPSPTAMLAFAKEETVSWAPAQLTILKLFSSSLICWARRGVSRLQVAMSPRRSYSPLGHVSWNWMRGLKTRLLGAVGVMEAPLESRNRPSGRKSSSPAIRTASERRLSDRVWSSGVLGALE